MKYKLTRRRFGQLAIASTVVASLGYMANRTSAAQSDIVYGLEVGPDNVNISIIDLVTGVLTLSLSLPTNKILEGDDQLTGFTAVSNGLIVSINPSQSTQKNDYSPILVSLGSSPTKVTVSGLNKNETLQGIVGNSDGSLYGLVTEDRSHKKAQIVSINPITGKTKKLEKIKLSDQQRFNHLATFSNGTFLTTSIDINGFSTLIELAPSTGKENDQGKIIPAQTNLNNGLSSLACSSSNNIYALGAPRYEFRNSLFQVKEDGTATPLLTDLSVNLITVSSIKIL